MRGEDRSKNLPGLPWLAASSFSDARCEFSSDRSLTFGRLPRYLRGRRGAFFWPPPSLSHSHEREGHIGWFKRSLLGLTARVMVSATSLGLVRGDFERITRVPKRTFSDLSVHQVGTPHAHRHMYMTAPYTYTLPLSAEDHQRISHFFHLSSWYRTITSASVPLGPPIGKLVWSLLEEQQLVRW